MANSLIASDRGLRLVNDARADKGWNRTDKRFLNAASELVDGDREKQSLNPINNKPPVANNISRATLNRFYSQQPIKHENFVAICKAVGINWKKVAEKTESSTNRLKEPESEAPQTTLTALAELDRELRAWFGALRYEIEQDYLMETTEYFEWIIRIPVRSRFDRVLIHGITGEAGMQDLARVEAVVRERNLDEGCLVTDYRVSRSVTAYLEAEQEKGNNRIVCLTFDELIDRDVDFSHYIQWLEAEIQRLGINEDYIQLDCSKPEKDSQGKYKKPSAEAMGAEQIDEYMDEWLESAQKNHISVLGEFGTGKTWFAMHYAWVGIQAYLQAKAKRVKRPRLPLLITLRDYAKALNVDTVIAGFFFVKHNIRLNADVFDRLNRMGKLLILFDGFDEMANKINSQDAIDNFWALAEVIVPNSKAILTCRTEHFPTTAVTAEALAGGELASTHAKIVAAPKFEILNLHPLSIEQIQQVLIKRGATIEAIDRILTNPDLYDLVKRPMMVDLVLDALPEISEGKDINLARAYLYALRKKLAQDIVTGRTFTSMADKLFFLCEVSWAMLSQNQFTLNYRKFPERLSDVFGDAIDDNNLDHWRYDMMGQTILIRDNDGNYRPAHKSLIEFFVAFKFAAKLGLLHSEFLTLVCEPSEQNSPMDNRSYLWSDYWQYCRKTKGLRVGVPKFARDEMTTLVDTFGASPLTPTVMKLLVQMLDLEIIDCQSDSVLCQQLSPLLELMQWTQGKTLDQVNYLGSNAGSVLVKLNPCGLEHQDLSDTVLPNIDLIGAGLRGVNLAGANLTNALTTETFSTCYAIAISPDNQFFCTGHEDGSVRTWTIEGRELFCRGHKESVRAVAMSGEWLFSASDDKTIKQWDITTGKHIHTFTGHQDWLWSVTVSGKWLFSSGDDKTIKQWDIDTGSLIYTFEGHQESVRAVAVSGKWLFSASDDKTVKQWDIATGSLIYTFEGHQESVRAVAVSGEWLFSASDDKTIKQWDIATRECVHTFTNHQDWVSSLAVSGEYLFSGSHDKKIKQWDIATRKFIHAFAGHQDWVSAVAVSGDYLFSGSHDDTVKQWDIATGQCNSTFTGHQDSVRAVAVSEKSLFSGSHDKTIKQWDINKRNLIHTFEGHQAAIISVAVSGNWLFSGSGDTTIKQWDIATGSLIHTFTGHQAAIRAVSVSGEYLFSGSHDKTIKQWDIATGNLIHTFPEHQAAIRAVAVSENWLFSGCHDTNIKQWNIATGNLVNTFPGHKAAIRSIIVSGEYLFSGSHDKTIKQWDIATGNLIHTFEGHQAAIRAVAVSGNWLFSGGHDKTIKQWDIATGNLVNTFVGTKKNPGHKAAIRSIVVSGECLFSGSYDKTVKQWNIATKECVHTFDHSLCAGANITGVRGLTESQIISLKTLGAFSNPD
jgi:WD40 repeat protein